MRKIIAFIILISCLARGGALMKNGDGNCPQSVNFTGTTVQRNGSPIAITADLALKLDVLALDDTAGNGDTDKLWSASKIYNELQTISPTWGNVTGTLSDQTDLQNALNLKQATVDFTAIAITGGSITGTEITLGSSTSTTAGTIRWTGTAFQGYNGSSWLDLSGSGEENIQADWSESDTLSDAYIANKPTLGTASTLAYVTVLGDPGTDTSIPTEAAVRAALDAALPDIHSVTIAANMAVDDEALIYDSSAGANRRMTLATQRQDAANDQTGTAYTLVIGDAGKTVWMNNAAANVLTVPAAASVAFPTGTTIAVIQEGAGKTTITADTGVTLNGASAGSESISAQYGAATLIKRGADAWIIVGGLD